MMKEIVNEILKKREIRNLNPDYIKDVIQIHLNKNPKIQLILESLDTKQLTKNSQFKAFLKEVRSHLNLTYGMFKTEKSRQIPKLLTQLKGTLKNHPFDSKESLDIHNKLLISHKSTKERLEYYPGLYKSLFNITGKPASILDLACGLNPLSYIYIDRKSVV